MANYADLRGPVGMNRVFLDTHGDTSPAVLMAALKAGRSFASNGPLLGLEVEGRHPGDTVSRAAPGRLHFRVALRSPVAVQHLELVQNGKVAKAFDLTGDRRKFEADGDLQANEAGWLVLRAWNDGADPQVLDIYPYATTSPVYIDLPGGIPPDPPDAAYFAAWLDRVIADVSGRNDFRNAREREDTLDYLRRARAHFLTLRGPSSAR
jgi:hypothetical protein